MTEFLFPTTEKKMGRFLRASTAHCKCKLVISRLSNICVATIIHIYVSSKIPLVLSQLELWTVQALYELTDFPKPYGIAASQLQLSFTQIELSCICGTTHIVILRP